METPRIEKQTKPVPVKPYSLKELAELYGMSVHTISKWLKPFQEMIGKRNGRFYTNLQVQKIFSFLGEPEESENNNTGNGRNYPA